MLVSWLVLISAGCLASLEAVSVSQQSTSSNFDKIELERRIQTIEEISKNSTDEIVDDSVLSMVHLFVNNLKITIDEVQQTSSSLNNSNVNDTHVKGTIEKGKIMFQNSAISQEYVTFKIDTLSKYVNELEECKKYLIDQEKNLMDISDHSLQKKISKALDDIQMKNQYIGNHLNHLKEINMDIKILSVELYKTLQSAISTYKERIQQRV